jgi:LacI family transcriptional regulator
VAKKPTLSDVSRATGLSTFTVSRALSNSDGVSVASRERVLKAARELGYVPNRAAQELRKNARRSISVITASTSNHYYLEMMKGVERTLRLSDRTAVVADIAPEGVLSQQVEDSIVEGLVQTRTAGVIATLTLSERNLRLLQDWDIPVVFVDSYPPESAIDVPCISTDNLAAAMKVGAHFAEHGYRDWLFLAYPRRWSSRAPREQGLRSAAQEYGVDFHVLECDNDENSAYHALGGYLGAADKKRPRALIAGNTPLLHGALTALQERHISVPEDVAVISYDDFVWAPLLNPPLTVLDEDSESIGELAAQTLTRIVEEQIAAERAGRSARPVYRPEDRKEVSADLVIRRSCGC